MVNLIKIYGASDHKYEGSLERNLKRNMAEINNLQKEDETGLLYDSYAKIPQSEGANILNAESNVLDIRQNVKALKVLNESSTIDALVSQLQELTKIAEKTQKDITLMQAHVNNKEDRLGRNKINVEHSLSNVQNILNTVIGSNYIFGGSLTNSSPISNIVSNSNLYYNTITKKGEPTASYYQGDNAPKIFSIGNVDLKLEGVNAGMDCVQKLIAALHLMKEAKISSAGQMRFDPNTEKFLKESISGLSGAIELVANLQVNIKKDYDIAYNTGSNAERQLKNLTTRGDSEVNFALQIALSSASNTLRANINVTKSIMADVRELITSLSK